MGGGRQTSLMLEDLLRYAPGLSKPWLRAAFVLLLVGYGTKMGLAPDAHLEARRLRRVSRRSGGASSRAGSRAALSSPSSASTRSA